VIYLYLEQFQEKVLDRTFLFHSGHSRLPATVAAASSFTPVPATLATKDLT